MNTPQGQVFRFSFWRHYLVVVLYGSLFGTLLIIIVERGLPEKAALAIAVVAVAFVAIPLTAINVYLYPWHIHSDGLHGYNFWGVPHDTTWAEIVLVKKVNFGGLYFLRVFIKGSRSPLWLPLFLSNMPAFRERIAEYAPELNPLVNYFNKGRT